MQAGKRDAIRQARLLVQQGQIIYKMCVTFLIRNPGGSLDAARSAMNGSSSVSSIGGSGDGSVGGANNGGEGGGGSDGGIENPDLGVQGLPKEDTLQYLSQLENVARRLKDQLLNEQPKVTT